METGRALRKRKGTHRSLNENELCKHQSCTPGGVAGSKRAKGTGPVGAEDEDEDDLELVPSASSCSERVAHRLRTVGPETASHLPGFRLVQSASWRLQKADPASVVHVQPGTCISAPWEEGEADGIALVLAVVVAEPQRGDEADTTPDVSLLVMWGWGMAQIFAPGALEPDVRYDDRQIFWQRNVCADGVSYVQGDVNKELENLVRWDLVTGIVTVERSIQGDLTVPAEAAAQSSGQAYTYFSEFDHTSMRISSVHIGPEPAPELKRLPEARLIGADFFAGMACTALATSEAGFQVMYAVEMELQFHESLKQNLPKAPLPGKACSLAAFNQGVQDRLEGFPRRGEVGYAHFSPPCQKISPVCASRCLSAYLQDLVPRLEEVVQCIEQLRFPFVTVEEVPTLLCVQLPDDTSPGRPNVQLRPVHRLLAPLLRLGYQYEAKLLNSAHYGVPQNRWRLYIVMALDGYELPQLPIPRYKCMAGKGADTIRDAALQRGMPQRDWKDLLRTPGCAGGDCRAPGQLLPAVTCEDAFSDLPPPIANPIESCSLGPPLTPYQQHVRRRLRMRGNEHGEASMVPAVQHHIKQTLGAQQGKRDVKAVCQASEEEKKKRPMSEVQVGTITGSILGSDWHSEEQRFLTLTERRRAQGIPDNMVITGSLVPQRKQVGNAVPPPMHLAVALEVMRAATGVDHSHKLPDLKPQAQTTPCHHASSPAASRGNGEQLLDLPDPSSLPGGSPRTPGAHLTLPRPPAHPMQHVRPAEAEHAMTAAGPAGSRRPKQTGSIPDSPQHHVQQRSEQQLQQQVGQDLERRLEAVEAALSSPEQPRPSRASASSPETTWFMPRSRPPQPYAHADPAIGIPEQLQPAQHQQALHAPPGGTQACRAPQEQQHGQHHAAQQQQQAGLPADTARQALRTPQQPHQPRHPQQQQLRQHGLAGMQHRPHKPHAAGSRMQQQQHRGQRPGQPLAATADGPSAAQQQQQARDGPVSPAEHTCAEAASPAAGSQCQKPLASPAPAFTTPQQQRAPRQVHRSQQGQRQSGPEQPAPRKLLADHGVTIRGPAPSSAAVQGDEPNDVPPADVPDDLPAEAQAGEAADSHLGLCAVPADAPSTPEAEGTEHRPSQPEGDEEGGVGLTPSSHLQTARPHFHGQAPQQQHILIDLTLD